MSAAGASAARAATDPDSRTEIRGPRFAAAHATETGCPSGAGRRPTRAASYAPREDSSASRSAPGSSAASFRAFQNVRDRQGLREPISNVPLK
jgi:hypothetical protein